jgi:hypothetical protein
MVGAIQILLCGSRRRFLESPGSFHLLNHLLDPEQQTGVSNGRQIRIEGFAEGGVHAARERRWKIFLRLTRGDLSPS